jgi:uncharacterized RDD family membrane protein YckC
VDGARATIRAVVSFASSILLFLGFIIAIFSKKKQTLHDMAASTCVVKR